MAVTKRNLMALGSAVAVVGLVVALLFSWVTSSAVCGIGTTTCPPTGGFVLMPETYLGVAAFIVGLALVALSLVRHPTAIPD
jgi:hypothetical protein